MEFVQEILLENLKKKLNKFIDFDELKQIVLDYKILLSGSFLLQIITGENFDYYDIDFFVLGERNLDLEYKFRSLLVKSGYELFNNNDKNEQKNLEKISKSEIAKRKLNEKNYLSRNVGIDYEINGINSVSSFGKFSNIIGIPAKFQLIYIDNKIYNSTIEFIKEFDLDICMNYWNGKNIFIEYPNAIKERKSTLYINNEIYKLTGRQYSRIHKYINRNYNIKINFKKLNCTYDLIMLNENNLSMENLKNENLKNENLILMINSNKIKLNIFPCKIKNLIIMATEDFNLDNIPLNLEFFRIYRVNLSIDHKDIVDIKKYKNIKIPFGCKYLINDNEIEI